MRNGLETWGKCRSNLLRIISTFAPDVARAAVVPNAKYVADAGFWETVAVNRGLSVRIFKDTDAARAWLLGS